MDFNILDREVRTVALVGMFLQRWASMESAINNAIGKALGLDDLQTLVVAKNIQFRDKTHILRTALTLSDLSPLDREKYDGILNDIAGVSHVRNMMAHDLFLPSQKTDGVEFLVVKAKGRLNFPEEDWPIAKFIEWFNRLAIWRGRIDNLNSALDPKIKSLVDALRAYSAPSGEIFGLGILGPLGVRLPLGPPDANLLAATPATESETPQDQPEEVDEKPE